MSFDSKKLRALRKERDIRQLRIATVLRIPTRDYQAIELAEIEPPQEIVEKICSFFNVDKNYFYRVNNKIKINA